MTLELLRRDTAFRSLPTWIIVSALWASALEGVRTLLVLAEARGKIGSPPELLLLVTVFWLPLAGYLTVGRTNQRCSRFDLTLPVPARRLWWTHVAAVTTSGAVLLLAMGGMVRLRDGLVARFIDRSIVPDSELASLALPLFAGFALAATALQLHEPTLYRIPTSRRYVLLSLIGSALLLGLLMTLVLLPTVVSLITLAVAGVIGWRGSRSVPAAFTLIPREPAGASDAVRVDATDGSAAWGRSSPRRRGRFCRAVSVTWTAFGILSRGVAPGALWKIPANLAQLPTMFFWGLVIAGAIFGDRDIWFFFILITVYLLLAFFAGPMTQLHLIDPLPVSRRRSFALLVLPGFLAIAAGYGVGILLSQPRIDSTPAVELSIGRSSLAPHGRFESPMVRVPADALAVAGEGNVPMLEAPWGESHTAWSVPVARSSRSMLYSPFSTPDGSSPEFVALQLSRAIHRVYGLSVAPGEVELRFLGREPSGELVWNAEAFSSWLTEHRLRPRRGAPLFPALFGTIGLMWLITAWIYIRSFRATCSDASRKWYYFGLLGVLLAIHIVYTIAAVGAVVRPWVAVGLSRILLDRLASALPGGGATLWIVGLVVCGVVYGLVQRRFERIELSTPRTVHEG